MFDDLTVIGKMTPQHAASLLADIGENAAAAQLMETTLEGHRSGITQVIRWPFQDRPWQYTAHTFGTLRPQVPQSRFPGDSDMARLSRLLD